MNASEFEALAARLRDLVGRDDVIEDIYPLSPLQEGMLFHAIASESTDLYVVQQRLEINGPLDLPTFQQAWTLVIARHPALRTLFAWEHGGRPCQIVCRGLDVELYFRDLTDDPDAANTIEARFEADRRRRYKLDCPPLMRIVIFRTAPDRHVMLWSQHHLLQDGWSSSNVLNEVFTAYDALHDGLQPDLPAVRPFADYISWLEKLDPGDSEGFWRRHLDGLAEPTRMAGREREVEEAGYIRRFHALSSELTATLRSLARDRELSLNSVLMGALAITLGRHTGKRDIAFGVVAAGRPPELAGVESMVGMFINTLVVRVEIDDTQPVAQWLSQVHSRQAAVLEYEHTAMTDVQAWSGLGAGTTLTDTLFAYWNFGGEGASPSGALTYSTVDGYGRTSFPFSITVESADPINIGLDFDKGDFDESRAERFLQHYAAVLASMVAEPQAAVGTLEMLTDGEREAIAAYNETALPIPYPSVVDAFRAQAARTPDDPAIVYGDMAMTYADLDRRSERLAEQIIQVGGITAQRVAVYLPRSPDMVVAFLGVLKAGAAYIALDRHLPRHRVSYLLEASGADIVLANAQTSAELPENCPIVIGLPFEDERSGDLFFDIPIGPGDLAYVMYTSGSTGIPKGVMVTHRGLINYVWWARRMYGADDPMSFPLFTSSGFDLTVTSIYVPLVSGGSVVIYPDDDPRDFAVLDVFEEDRVDGVKLTPSHLALLGDSHLKSNRIRVLVVGGENLRSDLARSVYDAADSRVSIYNEYGPTEATVGCMIHLYQPEIDTSGSVPIGRPAANSRIYLLDAALAHVPLGVTGELYVAGDGLARGYLDRPDLTAEQFLPDPFWPGERMYRTGDLARWCRPGVMEYVDRADDQVKVRGNRIEPGEIEAVLVQHEAVANAAVAVREPSPGDLRLVAYYVPEPTVPTNVTELRQHLRDRLPDFMVTRHLVRMDALPLTANGKLHRAALPDTIGDVATSTAFVPPRNEAERLVTRLSSELLGTERVSTSDNFFELGGHSILAVQLIARLHATTGVRLSPRVILLNTLGQAAGLLPGARSPLLSGELDSPPAAATTESIETTAYFFGPADEPLFGMHSSPSGRAVQDRAVLLCAPIGWEYMRTHWTMRKIARLVAADGFHALRFDYFGTGDSSGDRSEATLERWVADIAMAADELSQVSGRARISVVGVRLGATLAALAAARGLPIERLVMWDPVIQGTDYLRTLERMHTEMIAQRNGRKVTTEVQGDELLGFPYPPPRRHELEAVDLTQLTWPEIPITIVASQNRSEYERLAQSAGPQLRYDLVEDVTAWDDLASSLTSLLPKHVPAHVVRVVGVRS